MWAAFDNPYYPSRSNTPATSSLHPSCRARSFCFQQRREKGGQYRGEGGTRGGGVKRQILFRWRRNSKGRDKHGQMVTNRRYTSSMLNGSSKAARENSVQGQRRACRRIASHVESCTSSRTDFPTIIAQHDHNVSMPQAHRMHATK